MLISISTNNYKLPYYKDCTSFTQNECNQKDGLCNCIDRAIDITFDTLKKHVDKQDLQDLISNLGYDKSFKIQDDWAVQFKRSKLFGKTVYYIRHSAIEYIFGNL